jgi:hypothetical protein
MNSNYRGSDLDTVNPCQTVLSKILSKYLEDKEGIASVPEVKWYLEAYPGGIGVKVMF